MIRSRTIDLHSLCLLSVLGCSANGVDSPTLEGEDTGGKTGVASGGASTASAAGFGSAGRFGGLTNVGSAGKGHAGAPTNAQGGGALGGSGGAATGGGGRSANGSGTAKAGAGGSAGTASGGRATTAGAAGKGGQGGAAGSGGGGPAGKAGAPSAGCERAKRLWFDDFETGNYDRWTSKTYYDDWGNDCQSNGISTAQKMSGTRSQRSEISCAHGESHRGYGGLQFDGDQVVPAYTNEGTGIDAPYGVVNTFHVRLESPTVFTDGTWFSFWTINSSCSWEEDVLTLGLEDSSNRLAVAHYWAGGGGERTYASDAPAFPRDRWVRITIYVNYHDQEMHVWQDGKPVSRATFDRPTKTICQWHWGAYASADNDDLVLYEDDNSLWKLDEPWTDFSREPWFAGDSKACE